MANLIPLKSIPTVRARKIESAARKAIGSRSDALAKARYEIVVAEGCYSGSQAPTLGWVVTRAAAVEIAGQMTHMPGNTCHRRRAFCEHTNTAD